MDCYLNKILRWFATALLSLSVFTASHVLAEPFEFSVDTDDGEISTDALRGKAVYIDFWASWCVPCRKSFPWMNSMQAKYGDQGFTILAINVDKDRKLAEQFLATYPANFQIGYDPKGTLAEKLNVIGMPMAFLLNAQGELVHRHVGFKTSKTAEYEQSILELLESAQ